MTIWQPGMRITAARQNDTTPTDSTTSGLVAATGFTVTSFSGYRFFGVVSVNLYLQATTGVTVGANTENITDTQFCTIPEGWRPQDILSVSWGSGAMVGEGIIRPNGIVDLRSVGYNTSIPVGANIRMSACYVTP
ncbi:hypothetical protein [Streptomyces sp. NPDC060194]|uniref:hypothetical protein n=1 Tax=Streptomyces sp. NPDC060194 TaxID=3347069 RepID=UPI00366901F1